MKETIVITGSGIVSALGCDAEKILDRLQKGERCFERPAFYGGEYYIGQVSDFDIARYVSPAKARRMDKVNLYTIAASKIAVENCGFAADERSDLGIIVGTGYSGLGSAYEHTKKLHEQGIEKLTPIHFPGTVFNASAGLAAIELNLKGPNSTVTGTDLSGEYALVHGQMLIQQGCISSIVVTGADDLPLFQFRLFRTWKLLSADNKHAAVAHAPHFRGAVASEGGASLLIENVDSAKAGGRHPLAVIEGIGIANQADCVFGYTEKTDALNIAVDRALEQAHIKEQDLAWISSAANGLHAIDALEAKLYRERFNTYRLPLVPLKSYAGEFASNGILRLALGIHCTQAGWLPGMPVDAIAGWIPADLNIPVNTQVLDGNRFLHLGIGIGGAALAIIVRVVK